LVVDEFHRALTPAGREFTAPAVGELLSEGRAIGASLIWTTQLPQRVPPTAFDQSRLILLGQGNKACAYLVSANVIDERTAAAVTALGVGQFVIVSPEEDWDGTIYQVPPPAPAPRQREATT
jgi:DNA helicase HerA-like ATPase